MEGLFINPGRLGAQVPFARSIDMAMAEAWLATGVVRIVALTPELAGADALMELLRERDARAWLGHSLCDHAIASASPAG